MVFPFKKRRWFGREVRREFVRQVVNRKEVVVSSRPRVIESISRSPKSVAKFDVSQGSLARGCPIS
jgi:hypothetical protein